MNTSLNCRVIVEAEPSSGSWNMSADETLLEAALDENTCYVRCYRWAEPTVSLGYFQDAAAATEIPQLRRLPVVRRLSGGGAILHHHELTYSCVLPPSHPLASAPQRLYQLVHGRILSVLARFGATAGLRGESDEPQPERSSFHTDRGNHGEQLGRCEGPIPDGGADPSTGSDSGSRFELDSVSRFLCFARSDPRDVILGGHKVVGSAQRRRRGAVLQHGSLLLERSRHAPQFPGIRELCRNALPVGRLTELLAAELGRLVGGNRRVVTFPAELIGRATQLQRERYCRTDWRVSPRRRRPTADAVSRCNW